MGLVSTGSSAPIGAGEGAGVVSSSGGDSGDGTVGTSGISPLSKKTRLSISWRVDESSVGLIGLNISSGTSTGAVVVKILYTSKNIQKIIVAVVIIVIVTRRGAFGFFIGRDFLGPLSYRAFFHP